MSSSGLYTEKVVSIDKALKELKKEVATIKGNQQKIDAQNKEILKMLRILLDSRGPELSCDLPETEDFHIYKWENMEFEDLKRVTDGSNYYVIAPFKENRYAETRYAFYQIDINEGILIETEHNASGFGYKSIENAVKYAEKYLLDLGITTLIIKQY